MCCGAGRKGGWAVGGVGRVREEQLSPWDLLTDERERRGGKELGRVCERVLCLAGLLLKRSEWLGVSWLIYLLESAVGVMCLR